MKIPKLINDAAVLLIRFARRRNPVYRDTFDRLFRTPIVACTQFLINLGRKNLHLALAQESPLHAEDEITERIIDLMAAFLRKHYTDGIALRAGNTKTYGLLKASFAVRTDFPEHLAVGVFEKGEAYRAWLRFAGPGPLETADIDNNGILSIGVKLMGAQGPKLIDDEVATQDFTGISAPTFTTPNVAENLKLQRQILNDTPAWYFLNPLDSHYLDAIMQGMFAKTYANPLQLSYYSCVPYLHGEGRAIKYRLTPRIGRKSRIPKPPTDNYLREAMVDTLKEGQACFDFAIQVQTDAHKMPIENASVIWPEKLSPYVDIATVRIPPQKFDSPAQLAFARNLSFNPWHCLAEHRPLGNQNRARKRIYLELSRYRQSMNHDARIEPTGDETFD